jgi:Zn-dependent protease
MTIFLLLNILLAIFNLLPIPPLDGGHIVGGLLPEKMAEQWDKIYPYGFFILLILLFTGKLGDIINPIIEWIFRIIR